MLGSAKGLAENGPACADGQSYQTWVFHQRAILLVIYGAKELCKSVTDTARARVYLLNAVGLPVAFLAALKADRDRKLGPDAGVFRGAFLRWNRPDKITGPLIFD